MSTKTVSKLLSAATVASALSVASTTNAATTTFGFQNGDLRQDGVLYGSGSSYTSISGYLSDSNATTALNTTALSGFVGAQFRTGSSGTAGGQTFTNLFSYDLTDISAFLTANPGATVSSVTLRLISNTSIAGTNTNGTFFLYTTESFTTTANWTTKDGTTAWSSPHQSGAVDPNLPYYFTGGGSPTVGTANHADNTVFISKNSAGVGSANLVAGSVYNFTDTASSGTGDAIIGSITSALINPSDKKVNLMLARNALGNLDSRLVFHSNAAAIIDDRQELLITFEYTPVPEPSAFAVIAGLAVLGFVGSRRRRAA
jgi:hypothetical protein